MNEEENEIQQLYISIERITADINPLLSAGVLMACALRIYKTVLNPEEFENITKTILGSTDDIQTIEPMDEGTLH